MKRLATTLLLLVSSLWATNVGQYVSGQFVSVNNSTATTLRNNLASATTVQLYLDPAGTAQIFTLTLPNGTTIKVPSGAVLTLRFATNLNSNDTLGTVITATGTISMQIVCLRETKQ